MGLFKRIAAVVVPLALVVGGVAYGVSRHGSGDTKTLGECRTRVGGLTVVLTDEQARNASLISAIAIRRGMPAHAATIALATALQESRLYNLPGGDRDSLGLFQQRPSQGWGSRAQVLDPAHATNAFYDALEKVPGWESMAVTKAAQEVQRSGFPTAYAVYERDARVLASALSGYSAAAFWCHLPAASGSGSAVSRRAVALRAALGPAFGPVEVTVGGDGRLALPALSTSRGWALASYLVAHASGLGVSTVTYAGRAWSAGDDRGWTNAPGSASPGGVLVGL
jgi:hypothetical protein